MIKSGTKQVYPFSWENKKPFGEISKSQRMMAKIANVSEEAGDIELE